MTYTLRSALIPVEDSYATVDVQIEGDRIAAIGASLPTVGTAIDAENKLLLPGFVNGHAHSVQFWQRGLIPQLPLELWLADVFDTSPTELEQTYLGALGTAISTLLSGGTCVMDHLYVIPGQELESIAAASRAYKEVGIRAFIAPLIQDMPFVSGYPEGVKTLPHQPYHQSTDELLALMEAIVAQSHAPEDGIQIAVGPTGFHRCSDALFEGCRDLSDRHNLCRHIHLLETKAQKMLAQERYGGSAVKHLQQLGFLDHRTSLAHSIWLDAADIEVLAETKSTVVHNALSNLRLGSGIAPVLKYLQAGVNVAFGCDGAASNDGQDMLEAIKIGSLLHNVTDPDYKHWITPRKAVEMASIGGFTGVNLADQVGSLTVGKQADLVLYDLKNLSLLPRTDPIKLLILGRPNAAVDSVWVRGQQVFADGTLKTVDTSHFTQTVFNYGEVYSKPQYKTIHQVEAHYRRVMGLAECGDA
ncbi:amidohydrolase [Stenomitos frigidus]|uniref:Amidohydrolase n=1 Tax=Stenomitos frigidus ULC18 TaxID=2107698 RepID=A0A2T1EHF9_9CYAN|nr:amidohydrolase [Stenomitos frigidus]PSB32200.1 amidohydrolase [Stenomitos frigidus ULC18]